MVTASDELANKKYIKAKKRVDCIRKFYRHLFIYLAVNIFISTSKVMRNMEYGETFEEAFFDFNTFAVWFFWGIGLVVHGMKVFGLELLVGNSWEEKKLRELMDKENERSNRVRNK